jgi:hypothetical protein
VRSREISSLYCLAPKRAPSAAPPPDAVSGRSHV